MKKILISLLAVLVLAGSSFCFAYDGSDLNKAQKAAEKILEVYDGAPVPAYNTIAPLLVDKLKKDFGEKQYVTFQKQLDEQFGKMLESKFVSYERYDQGDRLTYLGTFSKTKVAVLVFGFDKKGQMTAFIVAPYNAPVKQQTAAK